MKFKHSFRTMPILSINRLIGVAHRYIIGPVKTSVLKFIWQIDCGKKVHFEGRTIIRSYDKNAIQIGDGVTFLSRTKSNLIGLTNPTILVAGRGAKISIGKKSGFSAVVINAQQSITIGQYVTVGGNVRIFDSDYHPLDWKARHGLPDGCRNIRNKAVVIEDDCFIGANAMILKGTHLGARSIVAAGSVVFGLDIPPDSMVKGNPAMIVARK